MKKTLTWILLCNIILMGLNVILLFSKNANAAPNLQAEIQTPLENKVLVLEEQNQALDARLREVEILLGIVVAENSIPLGSSEPVAVSQPSTVQNASDVPESTIPSALQNSQLPKPSLIYRSNARYGPSTDYPIATNLVAGEAVDIIGYNNDSGTIWFKMASGPWLAAFLVQNAPGSISYIPAPSLEEIEAQISSDIPVDAKSDPPTLPAGSPEQSSSSSVPITEDLTNEGDTSQLGTASATSSFTSTETSTETSTAASIIDGGSDVSAYDTNGDGTVATAQITTQFDGAIEQVPLSDTTPNVSAVVGTDPIRLPIGRITKPKLSCTGGCTEYPAWCDPPIKGHITFDGDKKIYYVPGHLEYGNINMDISYGERWFCSAEEAVAAGWRAP